jgi:ABC-type transport system involved in multi-copper enzyme maturation permease subunit
MGFFSELLIIPFIAFFMLSFSVNPFAVEEKGKLDNLYLTMPITRKNIVNARFGLSLIMLFIGLAFGTIVTTIMAKTFYGKTILFERTFNAEFKSIFLLTCGALLFYAVMNLSTFPMLFKLGYARGKVLGFYIPVGVSVTLCYVVFLLAEFNESFGKQLLSALEWTLANTLWAAVIMFGLAALMLMVSYLLSQKVYAKREF